MKKNKTDVDSCSCVTNTPYKNANSRKRNTLKLLFTLNSLLFAVIGSHNAFAHGGDANTNNKDSQTSGVAHAQEDTYWAEKAKNYPAFVMPKTFARAAQRSAIEEGAWGPIIQWPHIPVTAANLPDGRILTFASNQKTRFPAGPEFTYAATWNPQTNSFVERNHNSHDMFCGHLSTLEDGRIFINGGRNHVKTTSIFDYRTNSWQTIDKMNRGRWYPTTVALPTGSVMTAIGSSGGQYPELWTEGQGWKSLTGASLQTPILSYTQFFERNWWPLLHIDPRGKVFHSGPTPKMHSISTEGLGSITKVGPENHEWYPKHGTTVMFDEGKLLVAGGAISGTNTKSTNKAMIIDITGEEPQITQIAPMTYARKFQNGVMLPTGEVLVVGGNTSGVKFSDAGTILPVEIWNPDTQKWRTIDSIAKPRNYHSIALLLTDGRVLSAGGGLCGCAADHQNGQVLTPPYLYNSDGSLATRPVISNAPNVIKNGQTFSLQSDTDITKFSLIKMSSTTHAVNTDLRYLKVPFTHDGNGNYQLSAHANINVMTPGHWMLFAVNSEGVPSVASIIQVSTNGLPSITPPENQIGTVGQNPALAIIANDPQGETLRYQATGLPPGLTINATTGIISGRLNTAGLYSPEITVSDPESSIITQFNWVVYSPGTTPGVSYEYYQGSWTKLPDFNGLTPVSTGTFANFGISPRARNDNFAFRLSARIKISQAGNYTFYTRSDDGSRLWIDGNLVVDNDGLHASQERSGSINLSAGEHLIVVGFFELTGGEGLSVQYASSRISKRPIPASALLQNPQQNNAPEIINPGNQTSSINAAVNLSIIASDANGDTLAYTATGLPRGLSINTSTGKITGTVNTAGSASVVVTIEDGQGESASANFDWNVIAPISITPIESPPKRVNTRINYNADVSGGNSLRYRWNFGDNSATTAYSASTTTSHVFNQPGSYVITLFVKDGSSTAVEHQFTQAIYAVQTAKQARNSSSIVYQQSTIINSRIWNVNPDNNTVTASDAVMHAKLAEINVGKEPRSLALQNANRLWVVNKESASITIINTVAMDVIRTITLKAGSQPYGIVFSQSNRDAYVVLEGSGEVIRINVSTGNVVSRLNVGSRPRHISVNATGDKLYVSRFVSPKLPGEDTANPKTTLNGKHYGGEVIVINRNTFSIDKTIILKHSERQDAEHSSRGIPNYLGPVVISPDGNSAWVPSKQDNIKRGVLRDGNQLTHDSTVRSISSKINLNTEQENAVARLDHDNGGIASTAIFSKHGNYLFVALEGSREIAVVDAYSNEEFYRFNVGRAPQGLALSPNGTTLYVHNFMDRSISVHDISPIINARNTQTALISTYQTVSNERLALNVFNGKQLFYDARDQRLAQEQYISCASCHNEGDSDGRTWDFTGFGEGVRNTIGLIGRSGTDQGPLHWTANFDEVQDFEGQIRDFGGTGLMSDNNFHAGTRSQPLGDTKAGVSNDLDDLAAYVQSLNTVPDSPFKNQNGSLTASATQGKQLFKDKSCDSCHSGQHFTDSAPNNLHDVGTITNASGQRLNASLSGLDTPTLRGLWVTAPYLHNGSANTIEDAIVAHTANTASLTSSERTHIANFLRQLDGTINVSSSTSNEVTAGHISIDGQANDWNGLTAFSNDPNDISGANSPIDWQSVSFAHDTESLYLLYKNHGNIDPITTSGSYLSWGRQAYIDTDKNSATGYKIGAMGADFILEGNQLLRYSGTGLDWNWTHVGEGLSRFNTNTAELSVSRALLGNPNSVYVIFIGDNEAYTGANGSAIDSYPDSLNASQGNQQFFEYAFSSGITPPNGIPVAHGQSLSMHENTTKNITLQGTDSENDPLTFSITSQPSHGTLTGSDRNITYTPDNGFTGADNFSFSVNDGSQTSVPATVSISVRAEQTGILSNPVNSITIDGNNNDWASVTAYEDDPDDISGSGNTIDWKNVAIAHNADKLFISYRNRNQIEAGTGTFIPWGWQTYFDTDSNPATGFSLGAIGADYLLEGGQLLRYTGTGTNWSWTPANAAQVFYNNDTVELSIERSALGLTNSSNMRVIFSGNNQAYEGTTLDLYPDNAEGDATGKQYFEYSLSQNVQTQGRPIANSQHLLVELNNALSFSLSTNNSANLRYIIVTEPAHGQLSSGNGVNRTYTPANGFQGSDQIRFLIQNGTHRSSITTITFKVGEGNSPATSTESSGGGSMPLLLLPMFILLVRRRKLVKFI